MPNVQVQLPFESLLNSLPQLTAEQLDIIAQKAAVMQAQRRVSHLDSAETKLLKQIDELVISAEIKARCEQLTQQQQTESLTTTEEQELAAQIDQMETINAQRLALLVTPIVKGDIGLNQLGYLDPDRWQRNFTSYYQFGMVERAATFANVANDAFSATIL